MDAGTIEVLGQQGTRAANDRVGYLPEERGLYKKLKVRHILTYYGSLKGLSMSDARREGGEWLERMGSDFVGLTGPDAQVQGVLEQLGYRMPPFDRIDNEHFAPAFERGMAEQVAEIEAIAGNSEAPTFDNTIAALESAGIATKATSYLVHTATRHLQRRRCPPPSASASRLLIESPNPVPPNRRVTLASACENGSCPGRTAETGGTW